MERGGETDSEGWMSSVSAIGPSYRHTKREKYTDKKGIKMTGEMKKDRIYICLFLFILL